MFSLVLMQRFDAAALIRNVIGGGFELNFRGRA